MKISLNKVLLFLCLTLFGHSLCFSNELEDSLNFSTTIYTEEVNGLSLRVTYPLELDYGEDIRLVLDFKIEKNNLLRSVDKLNFTFENTSILLKYKNVKHNGVYVKSLRPNSSGLNVNNIYCSIKNDTTLSKNYIFNIARVDQFHPQWVGVGIGSGSGGYVFDKTFTLVKSLKAGEYDCYIEIIVPKNKSNSWYGKITSEHFFISINEEHFVKRPHKVIFPKIVSYHPIDSENGYFRGKFEVIKSDTLILYVRKDFYIGEQIGGTTIGNSEETFESNLNFIIRTMLDNMDAHNAITEDFLKIPLTLCQGTNPGGHLSGPCFDGERLPSMDIIIEIVRDSE